jgi:hypothetical protein
MPLSTCHLKSAIRRPATLRPSDRPSCDYVRKAHEVLLEPNGVLFKASGLSVALSAAVPLRQAEQGSVTAEFLLEEGRSEGFLLRGHLGDDILPCPPIQEEAEVLFQGTVTFWQKWLSACTYRGRWREQVQRSALALKLLTFEPTGAIVAAPTASLPEVIGGTRNWDYRYTWLRDAAGGLVSDSLVYRYPPNPLIDGLPGGEGTFNMCSFWLVEALTRAGQAIPEKLEQLTRTLPHCILGKCGNRRTGWLHGDHSTATQSAVICRSDRLAGAGIHSLRRRFGSRRGAAKKPVQLLAG